VTKRHENLWLQGKELDKRVVEYWADPPEPFQENLAVTFQTRKATSKEVAYLLLNPSGEGDDSLNMGKD
jgi:hypothetical protein